MLSGTDLKRTEDALQFYSIVLTTGVLISFCHCGYTTFKANLCASARPSLIHSSFLRAPYFPVNPSNIFSFVLTFFFFYKTICMHIYIYMCVCVYIYIYIFFFYSIYVFSPRDLDRVITSRLVLCSWHPQPQYLFVNFWERSPGPSVHAF
jgi:hypothetical protein